MKTNDILIKKLNDKIKILSDEQKSKNNYKNEKDKEIIKYKETIIKLRNRYFIYFQFFILF